MADEPKYFCPFCGGPKAQARNRSCWDCRWPDPRDRFMTKFEESENGCWIWTGTKGPNGYGQFRHQGRSAFAHRISYEFLVGPIPEGLTIDHLCRNKRCVNPEHLEAVTHGENQRRGLNGVLKTTCAQGHPWIAENKVLSGRNGTMRCRICRAEGLRRGRARNAR